MKSKRRSFGLLSKVKHIVSNKKSEWDQDRKESKVMKAKADEVGKANAKRAKKHQLERQATDKYKQRYGVSDNPIKTSHSTKKARPKTSSQPRTSKPPAAYDPFGIEGLLK